MTRAEKDEEREERIEMRIIVDTYSPEEQAWGWCEYLDDTMDFPFEAPVSPSKRSHRWRKAKQYA